MRKLVIIASLLFLSCAAFHQEKPSAVEILAKADEEFSKGNYSKAEKLYTDYLTVEPLSPDVARVHFMLGKCLYEDKDFEAALSKFRFVTTNFPTSEYAPEADLMLGKCYLALSPRPELDQSYTRRAILYFRNFIESYPDSPLVPEAKKGIKQAREKLARKQLLSAKFYFKISQFKAAKIYLEELVDEYPEVTFIDEARLLLAKTYLHLGEREKASSLLKELIKSPEKKIARESERELEKLKDE